MLRNFEGICYLQGGYAMFARMGSLMLSLSLIASSLLAAVSRADLTIVANGKSKFTIYVAADAQPSVKQAASELQRVLKIATGVELPIRNEPSTPMICLGNNASSAQAGVNTDGLPTDAFKMVVKGGNLYLTGNDSPSRWSGWTSRGTYFAVCDFLEKYVGARWLMPGEVGEDIPSRNRITVPNLTITEIPDFDIRRLADVQEKRPASDWRQKAVREWFAHQKIDTADGSRRILHWHSWDVHISKEELAAHPEWHAVGGDKGKFCTSQPAVIQRFAEGVIKWLTDHPQMLFTAISPQDGGGFCQCDKCKPFWRNDPHGRPSCTFLVLDFYNKVARLVREKLPDRFLAGYVYYNYMYPPSDPVQMEPNVYLVLAPLNYYGWGLQKPVYRAEFDDLIKSWTKITPNFVYHNYSNWMRAFNGTPIPPAFDILKLELPTVKKYGAKGVEMVGIGAWGYGAPTNYLYAKQMWDTDVDLEATYREWLQRAYGPGWEPMDKLYRMIEQRLKTRKEKESPVYKGEMYEINYAVAEDVFAPVFGEMEKLYLEALSKAATEKQRQRLAMFGENLIILHWSLRKVGLIAETEKSTFYLSDEQFERFLADTENSLAPYRDGGKRYTKPIWKGEWRGD